jgi:hypothetical protein
MKKCDLCNQPLNDNEKWEHNGHKICEDCYIDGLLPKVRKMHYENSTANFMIRLKDSYIAFPQKFH